MGDTTQIAWCDATFNPWIGCHKVQAACQNCYAESYAKRTGMAEWGHDAPRTRTTDKYWTRPVQVWQRDAAAAGRYSKVFCASLADVYEDHAGPVVNARKQRLYRCDGGHYGTLPERCEVRRCASGGVVPATLDALRLDLFSQVIDRTPNLVWLLLTKRLENAARLTPAPANSPCRDASGYASHDFLGEKCRRCDGGYRPNVWTGGSAGTQKDFDASLEKLKRLPRLGPVRFLSLEPLLSPIDVSAARGLVDWIIVGGESIGSRPCNLRWIWRIIVDAKKAGIPVFVKQMGRAPYLSQSDDYDRAPAPHGRRPWPWINYRDDSGADPAEWPEEYRVFQQPNHWTELHG